MMYPVLVCTCIVDCIINFYEESPTPGSGWTDVEEMGEGDGEREMYVYSRRI